MRILHIEDDATAAASCELMLKSEGFYYECADLGEEGLDRAKHYTYDIILLRLDLPDVGGISVLRRLREAKITTPVMVVTGCPGIDIKTTCFNLGADDYLAKPFHKDELICRIRAIVRRTLGHARPTIEIGDLTLHLDDKSASVSGERVHLTPKEFHFLELLVLRKDVVVEKHFALDHLYAGIDVPYWKIIDVFTSKVRRALRLAGSTIDIETVWGRGYRLRSPAKLEAAQ